jgi:predicted ester cyclase
VDPERLTPERLDDAHEVVATVLRMVTEGFRSSSEDDVRALFTEDFVDHSPVMEGDPWGRIQHIKGAFPDARMTIHDLIVDGDTVAWRWTFAGTHEGEFAGVGPTGRFVSYDGVSIERVRDGKIAERWDFPDLMAALSQLGVLPPAAGPG